MSAVLNYRLIEKLGSGAMGQIYKAQDTRLNRYVAIKVLPPDQAGDPERQRRFIQEAQAASSLNHPNIVTIHNIINEGDMLYIVMEYIGGKTLHDTIASGALPIPQVLRWATQLANALNVAHSAGIVHRDLKPANIMITDSGLVKVLDFGLAKWTGNSAALGAPTAAAAIAGMGSPKDETAVIEAPLTVEGSILGTLNYMAPEQAEGRRVDSRADVFAFGAVLYEMITGRRAFVGDSAVAILSAVLRDEITPIKTLVPGVPPELERIVERCLRKSPDDRWQSMREVEAAIREIRYKPDAPPPLVVAARSEPDIPPQTKPDKRVMFAGVGIALVVLAIAGGWWSMHSNHASKPQPAQATPASAPVVEPAAPPAAPSTDTAANPAPQVSKPAVPADKSPAGALLTTPVAPPPANAPENKPAVELVAVSLSDALPFRITLTEDVPADAPGGQSVKFRVADGLQIGDTTVIAAGTTVSGEVLGDPGKKKFLGIGGNKMTFRLLFAESVENEKIRVRATSGLKGEGPSARPFDTGKGAKPKDLAAARGTEYIAYIDGGQTVSVHK